MRLNRIFITSLFAAALTISCEKDNDEPEVIPERDPAEQQIDDQEALENYLETHFYNYEDFEAGNFDQRIKFDTISGANADKTPLIEFLGTKLTEKTITRNDIDYKIYVLKVREGAGMQPAFTDSTFVTYRGELLDQSMFDNSTTPVWFDLTNIVPGLAKALIDFKGASEYTVNPDNTVTWADDFGVGAVLFPSGLGYFSSSKPNIPAYSPLVFSFSLLGVNEADHDWDGIPSWMEDLNNDGIIRNDNTDGDRYYDFEDPDDDADFDPTKEEIIINADGSISFPDKDSDGTPDYLDPDTYSFE